jgi:hypothetical protein
MGPIITLKIYVVIGRYKKGKFLLRPQPKIKLNEKFYDLNRIR